MRTFASTLILSSAAALSAAPASASEVYGGVMGSYVVPDSARATDDGLGGAVFLGFPFSDAVAAELNVFAHQADLDSGAGELKALGGSIDLNAGLGASGAMRPFVLMGIGYEEDKAGGASGKDRSPLLDLGAGFVWKALRAELRWYGLTEIDRAPDRDLVQDFRLNAGLQFGGKPAPAPVVVVAAPMPAPVAAPEPPPPPPLDTDGDGVADNVDKCPATPSGRVVDASGCVNIAKVVLKGVNFAPSSATLLPGAADQLREVASAMKANPDLKVEVDGYTDSLGAADKNKALSEARAQSVKSFLVKEGVDAGRLTTKGFGAADPVDSNKTREGRANNRRVSFKVL